VHFTLPHAGARLRSLPLSPQLSEEDRRVVDNLVKIVAFLQGGATGGGGSSRGLSPDPALMGELLPVLPTVAREVVPQLATALLSRISARIVRELYA
jgi:aarF domain-containing kinase